MNLSELANDALSRLRSLRSKVKENVAPPDGQVDQLQRRQDPLKHYMNKGIGEVDGWIAHDVVFPLAEIMDYQSKSGIEGGVAEIGVHHGQMFILLALGTTAPERAVGIDLFENQQANVDGSGEGDRGILHQNMERALVDIDRVDLITSDSTAVTPQQITETAGGPIRLFSVDGGHTPELTLNDLVLADATLMPQGVVILDDVFSPIWPGVIQGLMQFLDRDDTTLVPFALLGNRTLLCAPDQVDTYRQLIEKFKEHLLNREDILFGHDVTILHAP